MAEASRLRDVFVDPETGFAWTTSVVIAETSPLGCKLYSTTFLDPKEAAKYAAYLRKAFFDAAKQRSAADDKDVVIPNIYLAASRLFDTALDHERVDESRVTDDKKAPKEIQAIFDADLEDGKKYRTTQDAVIDAMQAVNFQRMADVWARRPGGMPQA